MHAKGIEIQAPLYGVLTQRQGSTPEVAWLTSPGRGLGSGILLCSLGTVAPPFFCLAQVILSQWHPQ